MGSSGFRSSSVSWPSGMLCKYASGEDMSSVRSNLCGLHHMFESMRVCCGSHVNSSELMLRLELALCGTSVSTGASVSLQAPLRVNINDTFRKSFSTIGNRSEVDSDFSTIDNWSRVRGKFPACFVLCILVSPRKSSVP